MPLANSALRNKLGAKQSNFLHQLIASLRIPCVLAVNLLQPTGSKNLPSQNQFLILNSQDSIQFLWLSIGFKDKNFTGW